MKEKRVFITGIDGFVGQHLVRLIRSERPDWQLIGLVQPRGRESVLPPLPAQLFAGVSLFEGDITNRNRVAEVVSQSSPDAVIHLAAMTYVPDADKNSGTIMNVNVGGTINLLDAAASLAEKKVRFLFVSSSMVYGAVTGDQCPVTEDHKIDPVNLYGISKASSEMVCGYFSRMPSIDMVILRPFNHIGPGQRDSFVISNFAKQIASIEQGVVPPRIEVGNISVKRDFTDVRDIVRAYMMLCESDVQGFYNLCSGSSLSIQDVLHTLIGLSTVSDIAVTQRQDRLRNNDIADVYGDYARIHSRIGWKPLLDIRQTCGEILAFWREQIKAGCMV